MMIMRPPQHGQGCVSVVRLIVVASASLGSLVRCRHVEQLAGSRDVVGAAAAGEQPVVADAVEAAVAGRASGSGG